MITLSPYVEIFVVSKMFVGLFVFLIFYIPSQYIDVMAQVGPGPDPE